MHDYYLGLGGRICLVVCTTHKWRYGYTLIYHNYRFDFWTALPPLLREWRVSWTRSWGGTRLEYSFLQFLCDVLYWHKCLVWQSMPSEKRRLRAAFMHPDAWWESPNVAAYQRYVQMNVKISTVLLYFTMDGCDGCVIWRNVSLLTDNTSYPRHWRILTCVCVYGCWALH